MLFFLSFWLAGLLALFLSPNKYTSTPHHTTDSFASFFIWRHQHHDSKRTNKYVRYVWNMFTDSKLCTVCVCSWYSFEMPCVSVFVCYEWKCTTCYCWMNEWKMQTNKIENSKQSSTHMSKSDAELAGTSSKSEKHYAKSINGFMHGIVSANFCSIQTKFTIRRPDKKPKISLLLTHCEQLLFFALLIVS